MTACHDLRRLQRSAGLRRKRTLPDPIEWSDSSSWVREVCPFNVPLRALTRVSPQAAPLSADRRIGLLGGGGHCTLRRFRSGYHFINADHEGVLDGSRLRVKKNRLGAVDIGILQVG